MTTSASERGSDAVPSIPDILRGAKTIGMVGASPDAWRPSFGIMRYLQRNGFRVIPINPTALGQELHGERVYPSLAEAPYRFDIVNVFRRSDAIGPIVDDAIAVQAPVLWLQLGIRNDDAIARAAAAGIAVIQNRCISVEHSRLGRS